VSDPHRDTAELVEAIVDGLSRRGVPSGYWLSEIALARRVIEEGERALGGWEHPEARRALEHADDLLRRLEDAVVESLRAERGPSAG